MSQVDIYSKTQEELEGSVIELTLKDTENNDKEVDPDAPIEINELEGLSLEGLVDDGGKSYPLSSRFAVEANAPTFPFDVDTNYTVGLERVQGRTLKNLIKRDCGGYAKIPNANNIVTIDSSIGYFTPKDYPMKISSVKLDGVDAPGAIVNLSNMNLVDGPILQGFLNTNDNCMSIDPNNTTAYSYSFPSEPSTDYVYYQDNNYNRFNYGMHNEVAGDKVSIPWWTNRTWGISRTSVISTPYEDYKYCFMYLNTTTDSTNVTDAFALNPVIKKVTRDVSISIEVKNWYIAGTTDHAVGTASTSTSVVFPVKANHIYFIENTASVNFTRIHSAIWSNYPTLGSKPNSNGYCYARGGFSVAKGSLFANMDGYMIVTVDASGVLYPNDSIKVYDCGNNAPRVNYDITYPSKDPIRTSGDVARVMVHQGEATTAQIVLNNPNYQLPLAHAVKTSSKLCIHFISNIEGSIGITGGGVVQYVKAKVGYNIAYLDFSSSTETLMYNLYLWVAQDYENHGLTHFMLFDEEVNYELPIFYGVQHSWHDRDLYFMQVRGDYRDNI